MKKDRPNPWWFRDYGGSGLNLGRLATTGERVAKLSKLDRAVRLRELVAEANLLLDLSIKRFITDENKKLVATVLLFSGGNDSTVLAHMMKSRATHAAHANTGVGIEETRQFVRDTCSLWGLPLLERRAPRIDDQYRTMVLERGFPGPAMHFKMFQRLKQRALRVVRGELVKRPSKERVVFLAGRRRPESGRRRTIRETERVGSVVWVSPLVNFTKMDLTFYREAAGDVPRNAVSDALHMSGECLCGSYAAPGEREQLLFWYPNALKEILELEALLKDRKDLPGKVKKWGHGAGAAPKRGTNSFSLLCGSCQVRVQPT